MIRCQSRTEDKRSQRRRDSLPAIYGKLFRAFGPQGWWPGETPFEIVVGAILTQNTNWTNVERAVGNLRRAGALTPAAMAKLPRRRLAGLIRPAGYFNVKAQRVGNFLRYLEERHGLSMARLLATPAEVLRKELLAVKGIGPETADSILLYAAGHPVFVVDAYTRRVFFRHGHAGEGATYEELQSLFEKALPRSAGLFNEYHALIVRLGKEFCRPRTPLCGDCPLGPAPLRLP